MPENKPAQVPEEKANHTRNLAYARVFGVEGKRTEAQKLVLRDMRARGYVSRSIFVPDAAGAVCPIKAAITEGRRLSVLEVESFIRAVTASEKPKPTVKKGKTTDATST